MSILISDPNLIRKINEAVNGQEFDDAESFIRAAVDQYRSISEIELSEEEIAELKEAQTQCERGEVVPNSPGLWESFRKRVRERR